MSDCPSDDCVLSSSHSFACKTTRTYRYVLIHTKYRMGPSLSPSLTLTLSFLSPSLSLSLFLSLPFSLSSLSPLSLLSNFIFPFSLSLYFSLPLSLSLPSLFRISSSSFSFSPLSHSHSFSQNTLIQLHASTSILEPKLYAHNLWNQGQCC